MYKLLKLLGIMTLLVSSIGQASALSVSTSPIFATGGVEDFVFSYSGGPFTLSSLSFSSPPSANLLRTLTPFTTAAGGSLNGSSSAARREKRDASKLVASTV
jgi:hypothetical protein